MYEISQIKNRTLLYLIIFFLIWSISYIEDKLKPEYSYFRTIYFRILILFLIILFAQNNIPIAMSLAIIVIILSTTDIK